MGSVNSSEGPWLQRFADGKPVRKAKRQQPWKAAPDQSREIIASVRCILDRESFVREVDRYLRHSDFLNLRKTELLYKKYLEDVSEPFMQKIKDQMESQSWEEVQKRMQEQLSQYLNYSTKKGYVFLDVYDPSEYDPFLRRRAQAAGRCEEVWSPTGTSRKPAERVGQKSSTSTMTERAMMSPGLPLTTAASTATKAATETSEMLLVFLPDPVQCSTG
ncbi:protein FAM228B [Prinia subflava]|uniref:protein FAM228B n=1 Tax=Prinia subflava TaxID=208062 RepID=UPI002FE3F82A